METIEDLVTRLSTSIQEEYDRKYVKLGTGRNRSVYDMGNGWVVKVPINAFGLEDNLAESKIYTDTKEDPDGYLVKYAECSHFNYKDLPIVRMEKVKPVICKTGLPEWTDYVDCGQVGYNKKGELVAYDYGRF